ncbi:uncharacterized protein LOC112341851 [Selaginella moellendorffii]|uniref:uncharacterized protein LOC112341851 n=1 Tax=Selaginella moellendorffii TaxID=88036 RepID=UPI000D1C7C20|nr:uncharacterized protein LOC112341851 [Selaginella moellendorffii]|eukprot:XP_024518454.1 uncharacterized protein LOC112341851 [Selaginella moellendorffii]
MVMTIISGRARRGARMQQSLLAWLVQGIMMNLLLSAASARSLLLQQHHHRDQARFKSSRVVIKGEVLLSPHSSRLLKERVVSDGLKAAATTAAEAQTQRVRTPLPEKISSRSQKQEIDFKSYTLHDNRHHHQKPRESEDYTFHVDYAGPKRHPPHSH